MKRAPESAQCYKVTSVLPGGGRRAIRQLTKRRLGLRTADITELIAQLFQSLVNSSFNSNSAASLNDLLTNGIENFTNGHIWEPARQIHGLMKLLFAHCQRIGHLIFQAFKGELGNLLFKVEHFLLFHHLAHLLNEAVLKQHVIAVAHSAQRFQGLTASSRSRRDHILRLLSDDVLHQLGVW